MQKVQKATVALKIAVGIVVASIMVLIAGILVPFNPMTFGEYNVMPRSVCPGEPVEVQYTAKLDGGLYTIDRLDGNAHWVYPPNQKPYDSDVIDVDELNKTDGKYIVFDSAIQRIAPLTPGEWKVGSTLYVKGRILGLLPKTQKLQVTSNDKTLVKSYQDPTCFNGDRIASDEGGY